MPKYKYQNHQICPHTGGMVNEYESSTINRVICADCGLVLFRNNTSTHVTIPLTPKAIPSRLAKKDQH